STLTSICSAPLHLNPPPSTTPQGSTIKQLHFQWFVEGVMVEVELVIDKHTSGPAVNEGSADF
ncbi:hypothetical protein C0993_011480, partial [Termitomyces sp. T159_Od127]